MIYWKVLQVIRMRIRRSEFLVLSLHHSAGFVRLGLSIRYSVWIGCKQQKEFHSNNMDMFITQCLYYYYYYYYIHSTLFTSTLDTKTKLVIMIFSQARNLCSRDDSELEIMQKHCSQYLKNNMYWILANKCPKTYVQCGNKTKTNPFSRTILLRLKILYICKSILIATSWEQMLSL